MSKPGNEEIHDYLTEIIESERVKAGKILESQVKDGYRKSRYDIAGANYGITESAFRDCYANTFNLGS